MLINPSESHWYATLSKELSALQNVAKKWDEQEACQLKQAVLPAVIRCGHAFTEAESAIINLFNTAESDPDGQKAPLGKALQALNQPVQTINEQVAAYEKNLKNWGKELRTSHDQLNATVEKIQSQEQDLTEQIQAMNATMRDLAEQISKDKKLIDKARKQSKTTNVIKTIFGVILGATTGGVGAILAGMGVSSITEAESKVKGMEQTINKYQQQLYQHQQTMTKEQRELVSLKGLTLSAGVALSDVDVAEQSLSDVRVNWEKFHQELTGVIAKIEQATSADMIIIQKAWFNAACKEWALVITDTETTAKQIS